MKLSRLLREIAPVSINGIGFESKDQWASGNGRPIKKSKALTPRLSPDPDIPSIHYRSQDVKPGGLFVAIKGLAADGHDFVDEALRKGASVIVTQRPVKKDAIVIEVDHTRKALAAISSQFYAAPSEKLFLIGITGTNGKTTTAQLIESVILQAGMKAGVVGTSNYRYAGKTFKNPMTTPESLDLQKILADMLGDGVTHVVMEVTSHAIDLDRIHKCRFGLYVFTNLSQDHLDYHGDMDHYWFCKKRWFADIPTPLDEKGRILSVLNCNDAKGRELKAFLERRLGRSSALAVGFSDDSAILAKNVQHGLSGMSGTISTPAGSFALTSQLIGPYNLENILCAVGAGIALGLSPETIKTGIQTVTAVPGRLEKIANDTGRFVYVDYAHTPDALENVLSVLRTFTADRIICVFGCGGDRDKTKRALMGQISGRISDLSVITSDNPRTEPPMEIINQIIVGMRQESPHEYSRLDLQNGFENKGYVVEPDRRRAIELAISASRPNDVVLIAGKGNETVQIVGNRARTFDDREEASAALLALGDSNVQIEVSIDPEATVGGTGATTSYSSADRMSWTTQEILEATGGELIWGDPGHSFSGISIDSRSIFAAELFIAIRGEVHDGHGFIDDILASGVTGFMIGKDKKNSLPDKARLSGQTVCVAVADTTKALGDLAAFNLKRSNASVVAITGSNGKTSTRKMTANVVSRRFCTLATSGNLNNEIGLPLVLLTLSRDHEWAVLEMGMNRPGEIGRLAEICSPDVGVITNIGPAHLEGLGSLDAVANAKSELLQKLKSSGTAVLNADDPRLLQMAKNVPCGTLLYGFTENATVRAVAVDKTKNGLCFELILPTGSTHVELKTPARVMISNALAAAAVGHCLNLTPTQIKHGLEAFAPVKGRMNIIETRKGVNIIDDTYNANPGSMQAAIDTLKSLRKGARGILVAGDMLELGEHAEPLHRNLGSLSAESGLSRLYVTGEYAKSVAAGAMEGQMKPGDIVLGTKEHIVDDLITWLEPNDWVLVKGSRGMKMETIVERLSHWANE